MMLKLTLTQDETLETQGEQEVRTLRFPVEAVSALPAPSRPRRRNGGGGVAGRVRPSISKRPAGSEDIVRQIERTLDRVQSRFDNLKQQLAEQPPRPRFPHTSGDWDRPSAA